MLSKDGIEYMGEWIVEEFTRGNISKSKRIFKVFKKELIKRGVKLSSIGTIDINVLKYENWWKHKNS